MVEATDDSVEALLLGDASPDEAIGDAEADLNDVIEQYYG
jgi:hypothetical protein